MDPIARVPVPAATRAPDGRTAAYVVGRESATLVDPADRTETLDRAVAERGVERLAVTHTHPDHVGGVEAYAGDLTVWAHADHADRFSDATGVDPDRRFRDGDRLPGGIPVEVLDTPGHAPDHVAFAVPGGAAGPGNEGDAEDPAATDEAGAGEDPAGEAVLVGDLAVAEGSVVVGAPEGDLAAYLDSLRRVRERDPARLYPAHGPVIDDPGATLTRLVEHRLDRERRVLAAVEDGHADPDAVTDAAYEKDLTGVYDLARATVVAHLVKLDDDGAIEFDGERARPA